jgi:sporulation protein YqfD
MRFFESICGEVTVEVTCADISAVLTSFGEWDIQLHGVEIVSDLVVRMWVSRRDLKRLKKLLYNRGADVRILQRWGLYWGMKNLLRRPVLVAGLGILVFLSLFLPSRVLFIRVEGNSRIPEKLIAEQAQYYGVSFGADRRTIRSERVKNGLLGAIPQLQWVGVTTEGCVAKIHVRERTQAEPIDPRYAVTSIVASRDGVIQSCTVNRGNGLCKVGQAVTRGQVLISGYTDCGLSIRADRAEGEIMAMTNREISAITPSFHLTKGSIIRAEKKFSLIVGKKRINFYKDSGILDTTCVKMYTENYMTLPGAFRLPVILLVEEWIYYDLTETETADAEGVLLDFADRYLASQMIAGQILHRSEAVDGCCLEGQYACLEMIGQVRYEESIPENEDR